MTQSAMISTSQNTQQFQHSMFLVSDEIDGLLVKLAKGHLSTMQEEYADLKKMLCPKKTGPRRSCRI